MTDPSAPAPDQFQSASSITGSPITDSLGAFLPDGLFERTGAETGPLRGLRFAAKDLFDIAGKVTGCGNPDWAATHDAATTDAWAVSRLLGAGADLAGKTITDELAYSLNGQNFHYGTPANVNAPGRIPGGSSCGSAAAVAGGLVDFAIGTDTGGSVRIPASYCGLYGLRPSHGRLSLHGTMPLAESFDTLGWFTRDAALLRRVGEVLFDETLSGESGATAPEPQRLLMAQDAMDFIDGEIAGRLAPSIAQLEARLGSATSVQISPLCGDFHQLMLTFRTLQGREIWAEHGDWITATQPTFGPEIQERMDWAKSITAEAAEAAQPKRAAFTAAMAEMLPPGTLLVLPTAPGIAPLCAASAAELVEHRSRTLGLTAIAGMARLPQLTLPLAQHQGCPLGLSLIAGQGQDMALLAFAESFVAGLERAGGSDPAS